VALAGERHKHNRCRAQRQRVLWACRPAITPALRPRPLQALDHSGELLRIQRNALEVVQYPTGNEVVSSPRRHALRRRCTAAALHLGPRA
jgi:hypothetical protein